MLVLSVIFGLIKTLKKEETASAHWYKFFYYTKWLMYIQALLGITLMFISPLVHYSDGFMKNEQLRFYGMEHPLMMLIAVGLVSIGLYKSKKKSSTIKKNRSITIYYFVALVIMLLMIPWQTVMQ